MPDIVVPDTDSSAKKGGSKSDGDILSLALARLDTAIGALSDSRESEVDDLKFAAASADNKEWQWPTEVLGVRLASNGGNIAARPCLVVNKLPGHIRQVTNDQRQNRPTGKVIPANGDASVEVAEIYEGMVRHIEKISTAQYAHNTACENQTTYGEGYWRILTDYESEDSFDQEIFIRRIRNSFSVYMDPMIQMPCGEDADWCFITEDITHAEYGDKYPDATPISSLMANGVGDESPSAWLNEDTIRIAEYFYFETKKEKLNLYPGKHTAFDGTPEDKVYRKHLGEPIDSRMSNRRKVKWCKINGYEILEKKDWAGKYIPVIFVPGNEWEIEGQVYRSGIVRNAKDPQRMYNYWISQQAEMLALAPKAPFIGYGGQFEGYENDWKTANTQNHPYLQVNPDVTDGSGAVLPLPQRAQPPMVQSGLIEAARGAAEDVKDATGQYNAALGQVSNERSAKAINARDRQSDVTNYHYGDNLALAIVYSTRQLVDLIPKIYDTQRIARTVGKDGTTKMVKIDPDQKTPVTEVRNPDDHPDAPGVLIEKIYNPNVGKYDVDVVSGPGFQTKRQEALDAMTRLLEANPALWNVIGDIVVKEMDWPGHEKIANRIFKSLPPQITQDDEDPAIQAAHQQIRQLTQELQHATHLLQNSQHSFESREIAVKEFEARVRAYDAETKRIMALKPAQEPGLTPEQIGDIAAGTVHAAMQDPSAGGMMGAGDQGAQQPQEAPPPLDQNKLMVEDSKHVLQANQHAHEKEMAQMQAEQQAQQPAPTEGGA